MARFEEGSSAVLEAGPYLDTTFLLRTGREVGVCLGLVLVEACLLSRTGDSYGAGVFGLLIGEPSEEDTISSITGAPCFLELLLLANP